MDKNGATSPYPQISIFTKVNSPGVIELPRGSRGPRSHYIRRNGGSFGFTLRHFIVYPPDSIAEAGGDSGVDADALRRPMDTIFVKAVREGGPAQRARLRRGDRLVAVNGRSVAGISYSAVVQAISNSPEFLHLLVLPKDEDVLQRFYTEAAYNPASNQAHPPDEAGLSLDRSAAQCIISRQLEQQQQLQRGRRPERVQQPARIQVDAVSWRQLQQGAWQYAPAFAEAAQQQLRMAEDSAFRLSLDATRRDSSSSLSSSLADGSKDSLASYDSVSTLTDHEMDDSLISRLRQSFQQKEEFLRDTSANVSAREFYSRPGRLERNQWPPPEEAMARLMPSTNLADVATTVHKPKAAGGSKSENTEVSETRNPEDITDETKRAYPSLQLVQRRTREFESGSPLPKDDPAAVGREERSRSELARLGAKRLVPCVTERAFEYESRAEPPRKQDSGTSMKSALSAANRKALQLERRSLDSSRSDSSIEQFLAASKRLSGNVTISSGSKYIHCPPPSDSSKHPANREDNPIVKRRAKKTSLGDDERGTRRESYLKATEAGRLHIDSDGGDLSLQVLRSGSGNISSNSILKGEKLSSSLGPEKLEPIPKEGTIQGKVLETDDKFATVHTQHATHQITTASTNMPVQVPPTVTVDQSKGDSVMLASSAGQSPVSAARRQSGTPVVDAFVSGPSAAGSSKTKTWRGRVAKQFRKFNQGGNNPHSPRVPEVSTFGIPIEDCLPSSGNSLVPRFVEVCTDIIDMKGLQTVGIYRVCGNNATITALTDEVNRNYEDVSLENPRWNDVHVVSSLLKSYFRKLPGSLVTAALYSHFIKSDKIEDPKMRLKELKRLVNILPKHNYHTLKHIILHLKRVADNSEVNRMAAKNLAIVFGPTIVRPEGDTIESMVNNMTHQCKIIESLISNADWFFPEMEEECLTPVPFTLPDSNDLETHNQQILLENISKYEVLAKEQKEKNGALFSSIISAAQRKVKRKPTRGICSYQDISRDAPLAPAFPEPIIQQELQEKSYKARPNTMIHSDLEKRKNSIGFNYTTDKEDFQRRVQNFMQETQAILDRPRKIDIPVSNIDPEGNTHLRSSVGNVSAKLPDVHLTNVHSASNDNLTRYVICDVASKNIATASRGRFYDGSSFSNGGIGRQLGADIRISEVESGTRISPWRNSSVENISANIRDVRGNASLKKIKGEEQRMGSLDSLSKLQNDDESLLSTMTKLIDQKLKEPSCIAVEEIPYADEPPEQPLIKDSDKQNFSTTSDLYKNPSLHKYSWNPNRLFKQSKNYAENSEKEEDTMASVDVPDNDRHISQNNLSLLNSKVISKLKRSESLNKPERSFPQLNTKLKRSESLNKPLEEKIKRYDNLTKSEKTECNISKRREMGIFGRKLKDVTKNKRKNGMPDRSIKRRHTVGGTKDPDKVTWLMDNKCEDNTSHQIHKEKNLRTSSPELSSTRKDKLFLAITIRPVFAMGQKNIVEGRFPEGTAVFKVPLESHV